MQIFEKNFLGSLELKNRLFSAPIKTGYGQRVTDRHIVYYDSISKGGVAMAYVEPISVSLSGREHPKQLRLDSDEFIPSVKRIIDTIHSNNTLACVHLNHAGRAANPKVTSGVVFSSSEISCPSTGATAREMTKDEILKTIEDFKNTAIRVKKAGADVIEIQMGHGYLVSQFYSKYINRRRDEYSDPLKFANDVMDAVKAAKLPVIIRVSGDEMVERGLHTEELKDLLRLVENKGAIAIHVGMGNACVSPAFYYHHMFVSKTFQEESLRKIRNLTSLPIIAAGRFGDPERLEKALNEKLADFFALGRSLVADPEFPNKMREGKTDEIVYCGGCLQGCLAKVKSGEGLGCIVNPEVGWTGKFEKPKDHKRIAIVGGGPSGLEAAIVLKKRGYEVNLFEESEKLGGTANLAYIAVGKETMRKPIDSLVKKALRYRVKVSYNSKFSDLNSKDFDLIISAVGSSPIKLSVPGSENVFQLTGHEYFSDPQKLKGAKKILIVGGGMIGIEAADHLVDSGKVVTVVEMLSDIARDMEPITRTLTLSRLNKSGVKVFTNTKLEKFDGNHAICFVEGKEEDIGEFDAVVFSVGVKPNPSLIGSIKIGDAHTPGQIYDAVHSGFETALKL